VAVHVPTVRTYVGRYGVLDLLVIEKQRLTDRRYMYRAYVVLYELVCDSVL